MAKQKIFIDADGNVLSLHNEKFDKMAEQLGDKQIHRASEVEFNNTTKEWEVRMPKECPSGISCMGPPQIIVVATAPTRVEALAKEKEIVEDRYRKRLEHGEKIFISSNS